MVHAVVSPSYFRSDGGSKLGRSLHCCVVHYKTLLHIVSLHPGVYMGTSDKMLGVTLHPIQGYRNRI